MCAAEGIARSRGARVWWILAFCVFAILMLVMAATVTIDTFGSGVRHIYAQNVTNHGGLGGGVTTGVARSPTSEVPSSVSLNQNYPNPFNPNTIIRYELPERSNVSLTVFNILGQQVASLVNGIEEQGHRQVMFNGANFASGVYFYRLVTTGVVKGTQSTSLRKMILIK